MNSSEYKNFSLAICDELETLLGVEKASFSFTDNPVYSQYSYIRKINSTHIPFYLLGFCTKVLNKEYNIGVLNKYKDDFLIMKMAEFLSDYLEDLWNGKYNSVNLRSSYDRHAICLELIQQFVDNFQLLTGIDFMTVDDLSLQNYESTKCKGVLYFLEESASFVGQPSVNIKGDIYFCPDYLRVIRKLIAGGKDLALVFVRQRTPSNPTRVFKFKGYTNVQSTNQSAQFLSVEILGPRVFEVGLGKIKLFRMKNLIPKRIESEWRKQLNKICDAFNIACYNKQKIETILYAIEKDSHGAAVLFLDLATGSPGKGDMEKLINFARGYTVSGCTSHVQTFMDGAIVINSNSGEIEYIGVILDGVAQKDGDLARGARHNSVATFCDYFKAKYPNEKVAAVVFSEDGGSTLYGI